MLLFCRLVTWSIFDIIFVSRHKQKYQKFSKIKIQDSEIEN